jgi:8-oxo-dGTP pyrophosphatase MutT (NUDIX family)
MAETLKRTTLVYPLNDSGVLLGMKKRGFGEGWWNGFGGKLDVGETYEEAAVRETIEEVGLHIKNLLHMANLHFYFDGVLSVVSRAYISTEFTGDPIETEEMRPMFFAPDQLPYDAMWPADKLWIPKILAINNQTPLGFIINFGEDKSFKTFKEVDASQLEDKF